MRERGKENTPGWEHGSDFPLCHVRIVEPDRVPWSGVHLLAGSGRMALHSLLAYGRVERGWERLWVPSYYCEDVLPAVTQAGLSTCVYESNPVEPKHGLPAGAQSGCDVVLDVNYFGLQTSAGSFASSREVSGVDIIEDHTHDPLSDWAFASQAEFCIASLRKTLPLPDGGVAWSPVRLPLPAEPARSPSHETAVAFKLAAMSLKELYLEGHINDKAAYRDWFRKGEQELSVSTPATMSAFSRAMLSQYPLLAWRSARRRNHDCLQSLLAAVSRVRVLAAQPSDESVPMVCTLICDSHINRESLRSHLIAHDVFPVVLWPMTEKSIVSPSDVDLSSRLLAVQCDFRYAEPDMKRVGDLILKWSEQ